MPANPEPGEPGSGQVDWVDLGEISGRESAAPSGRRRPRLLPLLLVGGLAVAVVIAVAGGGDGKSPTVTDPAPSTTPSTSTVSTSESGPTASVVPPAEPVVTEVPAPILGITGAWELFGRGPTAVVRVELAAGRVTTTRVPPVQSNGPVFFVVGADRVFVRPLDNVTGYAVLDGLAAAPLHGPLAQSNVVLPGPDRLHVWRQIGPDNPPTMALATLDGAVVGSRFSTPASVESPLEPDGAGSFYVIGVGGVYDVRAGRLDRVTTGSLVAVGAPRWVAVECDDAFRCSTVVIDTSTGVRRVIGAARSLSVPIGSVAPDGSVAATYQLAPSGELTLQLLDLGSGHTRRVRVKLNPEFNDQAAVWAPDSSRLFVIDDAGRVQVVDPTTGTVHPLGLTLPALSQLAVR